MDLLCDAYGNASDDDQDQPKRRKLAPSSSNPPKPYLPPINHCSQLQTQSSLPGRYISKRQRALLGVNPTVPNPTPALVSPSVALSGSILETELPPNILSLLRNKARGQQNLNLIPERLSVALSGHTKAVNAIQWSPTHAHLLASAGMDHLVCIWNVWNRDQKKARVLNFHNAAVKDVKWSQQGHSLLSCGYDCKSRLIDIEKGFETQVFSEDQIVGVIKFHPDNSNLFLSGGSKGHIRLWDIRTGKVVHSFNRNLGPILDLEFTISGKQFISSSDVSGSNVSENSIIVWDVSRQVPLSSQVYVEAYTCPCVRRHPYESTFVAQSNGNYIAIFTSNPPFRLNKYKRYQSHGVSGFPIKCNFSLDGKRLASGSSDGCIYLYDYQSSNIVQKIKTSDQACIDVAFHPVIPNAVASCSWDGSISVFE
ncbi:hypothetical protein K1719_038909 [Acacia pycnantha]|nr:hypothetical protein K1719_038909 [Acacia pycnantha]